MDPLWIAVLVVLALANLFAFVLVWWDKRAARLDRRRVPEARLILPVAFGGLPGVLLGMRTFRHKTVKRSFQLKLAAATVVWVAGLVALGRFFLIEG